jgi:hypothetical protein
VIVIVDDPLLAIHTKTQQQLREIRRIEAKAGEIEGRDGPER